MDPQKSTISRHGNPSAKCGGNQFRFLLAREMRPSSVAYVKIGRVLGKLSCPRPVDRDAEQQSVLISPASDFPEQYLREFNIDILEKISLDIMGKWSKYEKQYNEKWEEDPMTKDWIQSVASDRTKAFACVS